MNTSGRWHINEVDHQRHLILLNVHNTEINADHEIKHNTEIKSNMVNSIILITKNHYIQVTTKNLRDPNHETEIATR